MPEISRFYGIVIKMFFDDHEPPHFHVEYAEHQAVGEHRDRGPDRRNASAEGAGLGCGMGSFTSRRAAGGLVESEKSRTGR